MLGREQNNDIDYWFTDAKEVNEIFGWERGAYMPFAIGRLIAIVHDNPVDLPVEEIDLRTLDEIAAVSGDFDIYFKRVCKVAFGD